MDKLDQMKIELKNADSMKDILDVLNKYYDLENCKPGAITKAGLIMGLDKAVKMVNAKLR